MQATMIPSVNSRTARTEKYVTSNSKVTLYLMCSLCKLLKDVIELTAAAQGPIISQSAFSHDSSTRRSGFRTPQLWQLWPQQLWSSNSIQFLQDVLFPTGTWDCLKMTLTLTVHNHIPIFSPFFFIKMLPFWGTLRFQTTHIMQPFPHSLLLRCSWVCNSSNANFPAMEQSSFSVS